MNRRRLRRSLKRKQPYRPRRPSAMPLPVPAHYRPEGDGRQQSEFLVLASYREALSAYAATLEKIQGRQDVSAVEGFVNCAAIVSAILKTGWRDEASALYLAARAVLLSRSFLQEFLDASAGPMAENELLWQAQNLQIMAQLSRADRF
jgi:hypothetical protein